MRYKNPDVQSESGHLTILGYETNGTSVLRIRNILRTKIGVRHEQRRATEKIGASVIKVSEVGSLQHFVRNGYRGMWRAAKKNGASLVKVRNILWNKLGVVTTDRSVSKKKNRAGGGSLSVGMLFRFTFYRLVFACKTRESSTRRLHCCDMGYDGSLHVAAHPDVPNSHGRGVAHAKSLSRNHIRRQKMMS